MVALTFRLTVVPWAAERTAQTGAVPDVFPVLHSWFGGLYAVGMVASYAAFAVLGASVLASDLPAWLGWLGVIAGLGCLGGIIATRFAGPFNPPILAHTYPAVVGLLLLI